MIKWSVCLYLVQYFNPAFPQRVDTVHQNNTKDHLIDKEPVNSNKKQTLELLRWKAVDVVYDVAITTTKWLMEPSEVGHETVHLCWRYYCDGAAAAEVLVLPRR